MFSQSLMIKFPKLFCEFDESFIYKNVLKSLPYIQIMNKITLSFGIFYNTKNNIY